MVQLLLFRAQQADVGVLCQLFLFVLEIPREMMPNASRLIAGRSRDALNTDTNACFLVFVADPVEIHGLRGATSSVQLVLPY